VGFTLFELLVVIGLMVAGTAVAIVTLRGGGSGAARDAAVALLSSRVAQARRLAVSLGRPTRLFVHADPAMPERFLRQVVVCVQEGGDWRPVDAGCLLPEGIVVLPPVALTTVGPGAVCRAMDDWSRPSGGALRSTVLEDFLAEGSGAPVLGTTAWRYLHFAVTGSTRSGDLVVAVGWKQSEALPATVLCEQPDNVAGLSISQYGVATFARGRRDF
jgi:type II secretory pathway pseudopilin PulG